MTTHRKLLSGAGRRRGPVRRKPTPLALEARLMFDGAALTTAAAVVPDAGPEAAPVEPRPALATVPTTDTATSERERLDTPESAPAPAREIAFVDTSVADWQTLVQDVRPGVEVILLDPARDGLAQIAEALHGRTDLDAVHIVSHGAEGALILGGQSYSADTLSQYQTELTAIAQSLSAEGDLLLYGCDIAQGSAGAHFIEAVADATQADVAASINTTGGVNAGGDWTLEAATGAIGSASFADPSLLDNYDARLTTINLSGNTGWVPVMIGTNFDPQGDSQAGAADTDLVGDATHAAMYVAFDDGGTAGSGDESMLFRIRVDNPTSSTNFGGVAIIGIDANLDGRIDLFFAVDGRNNSQSVRMFDPGTGLNNSPSNTTTSPLPTGWLPNNGIYPFSAQNYAVTAVSSSTDPNWNGDNDLGNDGKTDVLVTFKIPLADIATVLAKPSAVDRNGVVGPRGTGGISGFNENTQVRYVLMSQTQPGPINGDLGGVGANYDRNATFEQLGSFTAAMSPADPVPAGAALTVIEPVGDGNLSATEDTSVTLSGTSANLANGTGLTITISDGSTSVTTSATVNSNAWSVSGVDLSSLADGTLTVTVETTSGATVIDSATVLHDRTPPTITISNGTAYNDTTPTISGTSNLPAGSVITITVDPDNDSSTSNSLIYTTTVLVGGGWALDTGVVAPVSGTFPLTGLPAYSKITVSGVDAAGNSTTTTALNKPTVNSLTTNDTTPTLTGSWTNVPGDTLTVEVNGTVYTTSNGLTISGNAWSLTTGALALGTYDVVATVTRAAGGATATDAVSGELVIASGPAVTITGGATASGADTTPTISGTTTLSQGDFVLVRIDPNGDGNLADAVTYSVTVGVGGAWTVDTGSATPISGSFPAGGITGNAGIVVTATDANGNATTASQTLTITVPSITIAGIETTMTSNASATVITGDGLFNSREDDAVTVSGTSTNAVGSTVTVTVSDGDATTTDPSGTATVQSNGSWSVTGLNLSGLKDGNLTVSATVLTATDTEAVTHDATAPLSYITTASTIDKTNPVLKGITDLPAGSTLTVTVTKTSDGSAVASGTTTVGTDGRWTWQNATNVIYPTGNNAVTITVTSTATDTAGNKVSSVSKLQTVANNVTPPSIVVTSVTGVNYSTGDATITSAEIGSGVTISGTSSSTSGTVSVSITDGTTTINATPTTNGSWSVSLTEAQVKGFKNGTLTITATLTVSSITATSMYVPQLLLVTGTPTITVSEPIDNGILNATEDNAVAISGTTTNAVGSTVSLTVSDSDGSTPNVTGSATVQNDGTWTVSGLDLSGLVDGSLSVSASVTANSTTANDTASVTHDATAPAIAVSSGASATDATPVISGTTDLPAGSTLTITIDPNNDGNLSDQIIYTTTVQAGGSWSVNTQSATPSSGSLGAGLTGYAKITVSGSDQAGNSTTTTALNAPTVTNLTTSDTTPTLSGTWTNLGGDTLTVTVNGTTYTTATGVTVSGNTWSLTTNVLAAGTYNVVATVTRGGSSVNDATAGELVVDTTAPAVAITSSAITADTTPVLSGTTDLPDGTVLTVIVDPDNDNGTNNAFSYTVIASGGTWSVNTETALPTSGSFPASGLIGTIGVSVSGTDAAGNTTTATQTLTVDNIPPVVAITSSAKTPDSSPVITGTTDLAAGATITLEIDPNNDGNYADAYTYTLTVQAGGTWSVDTGTVAPDGGGATITLAGTVGLRVTGVDSLGNSASATKSLLIDTSAPAVAINEPVGDGNLSGAEDNSVIIQGTTTDIPDGSTLAISITDGTRTIVDTVTVTGNAWSMSAIDLSSLSDGPIAITATYTDGDGNAFIDTAGFTHDATLPNVNLTAAGTNITGPVTVTATFNEAVTGLTAGDFATSNGAAVSNLVQVNATTWTFTLTPAVDGAASVWLPASRVQDDAGNDNAISSALNFTATLGVPDTVAPTITSIVRQSPAGSLTNADSLTFRASFSEDMLNVDSGDFALSGAGAAGASIQSVSAVLGQPGVYDVVVTGISNANGAVNLALVASPTLTDAASNALTDTTVSLSQGYTLDNVAPGLASSNGAVINASSLVLSYNEALAATTPASGDFSVVINGATPVTVTGVSVNTVANTVTLTLSTAVTSTDSVTVTYTPGGNKTQDLAGNLAANLTNQTVTNDTPASDTTAPAAPDVALLAGSDSGQNDADAITNDDTPTVRVTLNGSGATAPVEGDVVNVYSGATLVGTATLSAMDISNDYVDITTNTLGADGAKSLTAKITDSAANVGSASGALSLTLDSAAPALSSATVNGSTLTLTYDEPLENVTPAAGDFTVSVNGTPVTTNSVAVDTLAKTVTLTLSAPVGIGAAVTVSYSPGVNQTQDVAGNAAAALSGEAVNNVTGDTTAPQLTAIDDGDADDTVGAGETLTYTVSFDEDIDATTLTAADFSNAGSAGITIGTITETSPGVFTVQVTTTSTGTLVLQVNNGASIQDAAGNNLDTTTAIGDDTTVTVNDVTAPAAPSLALTTASDSGESDSDRITSDNTPTVRVTFNGSGFTAPVAGDVVKLYAGAAQVGTATLNGTDISNGYVDITAGTLGADGIKSLTATLTDADSNISDPSSALGLTLDTTAPMLSLVNVNGDTLVLTYNQTLASVSPAAGDFSVSVNGIPVTPSSVALNTGAMTITLTLPAAVDNGDTVTVSYTPGVNQTQDLAGNTAAALTNQAATNNTPDTTAPLLASIDDGDGDDSVLTGDVLTYTVSFNEDIDASTVTAADFSNAGTAGITIGTITETSPGVFTVEVTTTSSGTLILQVNGGAVIEDAAGNSLDTASAIADGTTVTVADPDTTAPAAPTLALLASSDSGESNSDRITNDATPTVRVTLNGSGATAPVVGDVVDIYLGASLVGTATLGAADITAGYIDITTSSLGSDGAKSLTATITDGVSNVSSASTALSVTLNTSAPTVSIDDGDADDTVTVGDTLTYTLTFSDDVDSSTVSAADFSNTGTAGITIGTITETSPGVFTVDVTVTSAGSLALQVNAGAVIQDVAGNNLNTTSAIVDATSVTVDAALAAPTINAMMTVNTTPTLSGTWGGANGGSDTLSVTVDGVSYTTANGLVIVGNTWTLAIPSSNALSAGRHDVVATVARAGGGSVSDASSGEVMIVTAPVATPRPEAPTPAPALLDNVIPFVGTVPSSGGSHFDSQLGLSAAVDPLRPVSTTLARLSDHVGRAATTDPLFEQMLTSRGDNAFRIVVAKADEPSLLVFRGIPDQGINAGALVNYRIPVDAFVHTDPKAVVTLRASLTDGRPLPKWLSFDPATGKFAGKPPRGTGETLSVLVLARDGEGREAATIFRIQLDKDKIVKDKSIRRDSGRASLSEQIQAAAQRGDQRAHYASLYAGRYSQ